MHGEAPVKPKKRQKAKTVHAVDLFCGAGGTSTGLIHAVQDLGMEIKLTAINHWDVAIATHTKNHEEVEHFCQSIDTIDPGKIVPGGRLQLLVASPECTHHSNARGGKPRSDQKRADAWLLMRWIEKLYIENILIENVPEFESWGPLTARGLPDKRHKGLYFQQFISALRINYSVEWKVLNCADYGDPTTRRRLFVLARRNHKKIVWPTRTHASRKELAKMAVQPDMFAEESNSALKPWVPAREIIDWSLTGTSVFGRKKPLSPNTMRRIFKGLEKHGLKNFLVNLKNKDRRDRSVDEPTFTQATANHQGVCEPFIVATGHVSANGTNTRDITEPVPAVLTSPRIGVVEIDPFMLTSGRDLTNRSAPRPTDEPVPTVTGSPNIGMVEGEAFLLGQQSNSALRSVDEPTPTIVSAGNIAKVDVEPFIVSAAHGGNTNPARDVDEPLGAVLGSPKYAVVEPFVISAGGPELNPQSVEEPMRTVLTRDHQAIVEAFLVKFHGGKHGENRNYEVNEPIGTLDTSNRFALVESEPFVFNMAHAGEDLARSKDVDQPLATIAGKGMFGLIEPDPYLVRLKNNQDASDIEDPLKTLTTKESYALAEPYIVKFYGNETGGESVHDPLSTVTGKDRFGLCIPTLGVVLDIRFRMLQPHELAAAMSFPKNYEFTGNRENKVKQIGNAVPLKTAKALCGSLLGS